ncbi:MAPEG family protein [Novosphingobium aerophilum]|uniref:MAPEG family protein n=1 Tax=Novosphingobium aerophilum TaxID=2839843 RepID=A0A7X1KAX0_9SPHN|nr:MAPEG family protein [Novosphingobium aerophilum]MBC2650467.1 MAPEG family protein [Novosphingobium aerophilum]
MGTLQAPATIFLPMLLIVALTFVAFVKMAIERAAAVKGGQDPAYYKVYLGDPEPEKTRAAVRHWDNLFELPTLFYAACLTAFVLAAVSGWTLLFAWLFAACRLVQSLVHMSTNNPNQRGGAFALSVLGLLALWVNLALTIAGRL